MESSKNHLDTVQQVELLNPEEVSGNNFEQVTISAVKSPSPTPVHTQTNQRPHHPRPG